MVARGLGNQKMIKRSNNFWGGWVAQSVKQQTLDHSSGLGFRVMSSSPAFHLKKKKKSNTFCFVTIYSLQ